MDEESNVELNSPSSVVFCSRNLFVAGNNWTSVERHVIWKYKLNKLGVYW